MSTTQRWLLVGALTALSACQRTRQSEQSIAPTPKPHASTAAEVRSDPPPKVLLTAAPSAEAPQQPAAADAGPPAKTALHVAVMGDSLTDYRSGGGKFIRFLEEKCPKSRFENFAKGGEMVNQMRRRFPQLFAAPNKRYTHVLIYGGVNDLYSDLTANRTNERIQGDLTEMYEAARNHGAKVVALTVSPWGGFKRYFNERRGNNTLLLNDWIEAQLGKGVDAVVDTHPLLRCGDPHKLCPEYHSPYKDGLHIGPEGHRVLGQAVFDAAFSNCK